MEFFDVLSTCYMELFITLFFENALLDEKFEIK